MGKTGHNHKVQQNVCLFSSRGSKCIHSFITLADFLSIYFVKNIGHGNALSSDKDSPWALLLKHHHFLKIYK